MSSLGSLPGRNREENSIRMEPTMTQQPSPDGGLLMHELTHRINNEFTSAISMVSLAAARADNDKARGVLAAVADRLQEYARVHRALEMPEHRTHIDASAWIRRLCESISRSKLVGRNIELVLVDSAFELIPADAGCSG